MQGGTIFTDGVGHTTNFCFNPGPAHLSLPTLRFLGEMARRSQPDGANPEDSMDNLA